MNLRRLTAFLAGTALVVLTLGIAVGAQEAAPLFKGSVERVAVPAIVRDGKGKLVTNLTAADFELSDAGHRAPIIGVWSEPSPASVALLLDASGSMATKLERAREASRYLLAGLHPGVDEAALFSFDTALTELSPFSSTFSAEDRTWESTRAFGATSLWDAIADTAHRVSARQQRRAIVVFTDGVDSSSRMKPSEVSLIAGSLDVPVYIVVISYELGDDAREAEPARGPLADLAAWTGGELLTIRSTEGAIAATRQIVAELQHQYVVAFEPGLAKGWHPLVLRTTKNGLFVRARNGYMVN